MLETFTIETFAGRVGRTFRVEPQPGESVEWELISAEALGGAGAAGHRTPFSLVFRGPLTPVLPQAIYPMAEPDVGVFDIFVVPIGPDTAGMCYEAVFT